MKSNNLLSQWQGLVYNIVNRFRENTFKYKTQIDWDEMVQVGMIALWKCTQSYDESKGSFKNYAITAIKNAIVRQYTRFDKLIEQHNSLEEYNDSYDFNELDIDISLVSNKVKQIISKLNIRDKSKQILLLRLEGKSYGEIAKELGITYQAVAYVIENHLDKIRYRLFKEV